MNKEKQYIEETEEHINLVKTFVSEFTVELFMQAKDHDQSKLESPEKEIFSSNSYEDYQYGSDEYKNHLENIKEALGHHYAHNRHHPEHFPNGIHDMTLVDIVEMLCDWLAVTKKHKGSSIEKSIEINQERFGYSDDLKHILKNTVLMLNNTNK